MWIEKRGQQHRVYWRNRSETGSKKPLEPFGTREQASAFIELARASSVTGALAYVRSPSDEALMALLGRHSFVVGVGYGGLVFLASAFVGLPLAAAVFDAGDPISNMAEMAGWWTFAIEHLLFGLTLGALAARAQQHADTTVESAAAR